MRTILIVGSGASGVHFALSVLQKGYNVFMLDVGRMKQPAVNPGQTFNELKENLDDPSLYFLGAGYEAVVYPASKDEYYTKYYGFPPSKTEIFSMPGVHKYQAEGFEPLFSFAQGGLAEAWTAGVYPFNDAELQDFPFEYAEIEPAYGTVAKRMGISAERDDLARFFPFHEHLMKPLRLDPHSQLLLDAYTKQREQITRTMKCYLGRSRVGTLGRDENGRKGCSYCGRCLWGCPTESLYTPSITLKECQKYPNFNYISGMYVSRFQYDSSGRITDVVAWSIQEQIERHFSADWIVLAAGALSTAKIFMQSIYKGEGRVVKLPGLMDNRQILMPFVNLKMIGQRYNPDSYQYHQLAIGVESDRPEEYIHGQITTLKTALIHPITQNLPFDLQTSLAIFRSMRASLGIVNLNLFDRRRENNSVSLDVHDHSQTKLSISYTPALNEPETIRHAVGNVKKFLSKLGCLVPPGMTHIRPMGASVHYAGIIPMSSERRPFTTSKYCRSHDFENLYIVDGSTFPFLPAKNVTFSLMANAVRVAEGAF